MPHDRRGVHRAEPHQYEWGRRSPNVILKRRSLLVPLALGLGLERDFGGSGERSLGAGERHNDLGRVDLLQDGLRHGRVLSCDAVASGVCLVFVLVPAFFLIAPTSPTFWSCWVVETAQNGARTVAPVLPLG